MQKLKLQFKIKNYAAVIAALLFLASPVFAAKLYFETDARQIPAGENFKVNLYLDTEGETVNAIEAAIPYPANFLKLKDWNNGNSIINFWIEEPQAESHILSFAGIIPNGWRSDKGLVLRLDFEAVENGKARLAFEKSTRVLLNDGLGSTVKLAARPLDLTIAAEAPPLPMAIPLLDIEPPEIFHPFIARDPQMFNNEWFAVFAAQDKGSGIDYYEVEEIDPVWKVKRAVMKGAKSPYPLKDQLLRSIIRIKAVDKQGNERVVEIPPTHHPWFNQYLLGGIIVLAIIIILFLRKRRKRRRTK